MKHMKKSSRGSGNFKFLRVNGSEMPYVVERRHVRYPRLEFKTGKLLVVLPESWGDESPLLERKTEWISRKHEEIQKAIEKVRNMVNDRGLLIFGNCFDIVDAKSFRVEFDKKLIELDMGDENQLRRLISILKEMLLDEVDQAANYYGKKFGVKFNKIFIRRQKTKWASCSSKGNLSFNFWLICLPKELIRYVVCHEVLHLKERRHNMDFWGIMGREFEDYKQKEGALFEHWFFVQEYSRSTPPLHLLAGQKGDQGHLPKDLPKLA